MKYRAKGTIEAVQLNDPLEVANWVKQNVPEWRLKALNEDRVWFKIEGNPHATYYRMDGRWMLIGDGGVGRPSVVSNNLFQAWYELCNPAYSVGGYVNGPSSSWVVKDGCVALKKEVSAAELLEWM